MRFGYMTMALLLSACGGERQAEAPANTTVALQEADSSSVTEDNASAALPTDAWVGKWTGVEGLALDIAQGDGPGTYRLTINLLDSRNVYDGQADGSVIRFRRGDVIETIRQVPGSETGLKWLADKPNCLMIKLGEGFCRPA